MALIAPLDNPPRAGQSDGMKQFQVDVLIVGGGLVGGPLALALADAGLRVAVVDAEDPATAIAPAFDGRASALGLAQQRVLAAIGLWPAIAPARVEVIAPGTGDAVFLQSLKLQVEDFVRSVTFGESAGASVTDAVEALKVAELASEAAAEAS